MNESLAKQLHDLISTSKLEIAIAMNEEINTFEKNVKELIENNEKGNENE